MTIDAPPNQVNPGIPIDGYEPFPAADYHLNVRLVTVVFRHLSPAGKPISTQISCHTNSQCIRIISTCQNDSAFSPILCLTPWNNAISRRRILSGAAIGRWAGCWPKTCPPNRWLPSLATQPTGCARLLNTSINTTPRASATGGIGTPSALGSTRRCRMRRSRARPTRPHRLAGCGLGRRSPAGWPPDSGDQCTPSGAGKCSCDSACARKCRGHGMRRPSLTLKKPLKKASQRSADRMGCLPPLIPLIPSATEFGHGSSGLYDRCMFARWFGACTVDKPGVLNCLREE
jgi:hypothetical protein